MSATLFSKKAICLCLALLQVVPTAWAATLTFPDSPPYRDDPVNLAISVDDSGSMDFEVLFDTNDGTLFWGHNRNPKSYNYWDASGKLLYADNDNDTATTKHAYLFALPENSTDGKANSNSAHYNIPPFPAFGFARSPDYNPMYYDPRKEYKPWTAYHNGTSLVSFADATPAAARTSPSTPASPTPTTLNLTTSIYSTNTFNILPGMRVNCDIVTDAAVCSGGKTGEQTVPTNATPYTAKVTYSPATFWLVESCTPSADKLNCAYGPNGTTTPAITLKKYDINTFSATATSFTVPTSATNSALMTINRTKAQELQNFANWFTYYRKRKLLAAGAFGSSLEKATDLGNIRAAVALMNTNADLASLKTLKGTDNTQNFRSLLKPVYEMGNGCCGTPTFKSLTRVNGSFAKAVKNTASTGEKLTCQRYNTMLLTDGFASEFTIDTTYNTSGGNLKTVSAANLKTWFGNGTNTTRPYVNAAGNGIQDGSFLNRATHIASYYYSEYGLSGQMLSDLGLSGTQPKLNVDTSNTSADYDKNPNPHINFFGLTIGALGAKYGRTASNDAYVANPDWEAVTIIRDRKAVDDLWHATVNGRGSMLTATDSVSLASGIVDMLGQMTARDSRSRPITAGYSLNSTNNTGYVSIFNPGKWTGDVLFKTVDLTTGGFSSADLFSAANVLDTTYAADATPTVVSGTPPTTTWGTLWQGRKIASYNGTAAIPFTPDSSGVGSGTSTFNRPAKSDANNVVNYIRGDRSNEYDGTFNTTAPYPERQSLLRDIVNSVPAYVSAGKMFDYTLKASNNVTDQDPGYSTWSLSRKSALYVGANDGMLHAFDASNAQELWAYVPKSVWPTLKDLATAPYVHKFTVDGQITVGDVDFNNAGSVTSSSSSAASSASSASVTPDWHTILVGGLRSGGKGIYALDVTNTNNASTANVTGKVLWEFPNNTATSNNIGYVFGKPVIAKSAYGWVVLVASSYNNGTPGDGQGYLFVLNPKTGAVIRTISTSEGTAASPINLGNVGVLYENSRTKSAYFKYAYATDLSGQLWKFDLSSTTPASWAAHKLLTNLPKGISTAPVAGTITVGGKKRKMVFVATGRNIEAGDMNISHASDQHYVVGLEDNDTNTLVSYSTNLFAVPTTQSGSATQNSASQTADTWHACNAGLQANCDWTTNTTNRGFYIPLATGDQVISDMVLDGNNLVFTATAPKDATTECSDTESFIYNLDARTGTEPKKVYFTTGNSWSRQSLGAGTAGGVGVFTTSSASGNAKFGATTVSGNTGVKRLPNISGVIKRVGWREILK